jgi:integrase
LPFRGAGSLADLDLDDVPVNSRKIVKVMLAELRLVYFTRQDTKQAGFIEFDHYGVHFPNCKSHFDLTSVGQRWLRDLLWDYSDQRLINNPPRSQGPFKATRRGCVELSAYLDAEAPACGHNPALLTEARMTSFVADQRHRGRHRLPPLGQHLDAGGRGPQQTIASTNSVARIFDAARRVLRFGMEEGTTASIGLDRRFITALPYGGAARARRRQPFSDEVARVLARDDNLALLDQADVEDRGLRDIWEALILTGRRCNEIIRLRLQCVGRINGLPVLWHDQPKIGNLDEGIRIPERLVKRIEVRQSKTIDRFVQRHGRPPNSVERTQLALFPRRSTNRTGLQSVSYGWFQGAFANWVSDLDIRCVPHQARHTLATSLIRNGANLTHVKRYLGHVSDAMAEHYVHLANTDPRLEDALNTVWVSGPGSAAPGLLLSSGQPMTRQQAEALAIDLTRVSTPAEGGFCTFQSVVDGNACPWNMDCHNCDKFVMSGADLIYWHRKREQWRTLAERASDPTTADYLHQVFDPTARAIAGLEKALAAVGLLDEALAIDLRRPQDYFGRVWATAFRAQELTHHTSSQPDLREES